MTITDAEYRRIGRGIEIRRYHITNELFRKFPYSHFDEGTEIARDEITNDLYKRLDRSITDEEMDKFRKLYVQHQRTHT